MVRTRQEKGPPIALLLVSVLIAAGSDIVSVGVPASTTLLGDGVRFAFSLEHRLLVVGTDSVLVDGEALGRSEYALDYTHGWVVFRTRPDDLAAILVSYRYVPFFSESVEYRLHRLKEDRAVEEQGYEPAASRAENPGIRSTGDLSVSGDKSIGVSVGGVEGTGINQSTRLNVTGVLEGIRIEAELSDQSSGIPAEGTTREVDELDRIAVRIEGDRWKGSFGDVELGLGVPGFGRVERRAVGALVNVGLGSVSVSPGGEAVGPGAGEVEFGYAQPRGQSGHIVLQGRDGVQGPYVLAPDQKQAQVVPASERVYLDGLRMNRGWDADYTIDYSTGEVVFTNLRVIDRYSRIEALFQYVVGAYERNDVVAGATARAGSFDFFAGMLREGDDPARALDEGLTEDERRYLAGIGSDTSRAWLPGAGYVGSGNGSYVLEAQGYYRYVGEKQGDYVVIFTQVGDSLGDYVYDDTLFACRYVGDSKGDYVALRRAVLPSREELASAGFSMHGAGFSAGVNGVFRRTMLNLLAPDGAGVQDGAVGADVKWSAGRYDVSYTGLLQAAGFRFPGQDSVLDFAYRWGGASQDDVRSTNEFALEARPLDYLKIEAEAGMLDRAWAEAITRWCGEMQLGWLSAGIGKANTETRYQLSGKPKVWMFRPEARLELHSRPEERSRVAGIGVGVSPVENLSLGIDYRYDDVSRPDSASILAGNEQGKLVQVDADWNRTGTMRANARVARQNRQYAAEPADNWNQWLAAVSGTVSPMAGARLSADLNQNYRLIQLRDEVFRYVGSGSGGYSRDSVSGRYYANPGGDYERITVALGRFASCRERKAVASAGLSFWRPVEFAGSVSYLSTSDTMPVQQVENRVMRVAVRALEPVLTVNLGTTGSRSMDRTLAATGRDTRRQEHYLELESDRFSWLEIRTKVAIYDELRRYSSGVLDYLEQGRRLELSPVIGAGLGLEFSLAFGQAWIQSPAAYPGLGRFEFLTREAGVSKTVTLGRRTRVKGSAGITLHTASVDELPFEVSVSRPLGLVPTVGLEFSSLLSDVLTASVRYLFSDRPDRSAENQLTAELRAYF